MNRLFLSPEMLGLLALPVAVAAAAVIGEKWRKTALGRLGHVANSVWYPARIRRDWAVVGALVLLVLALARPAWRPRTEPLASDGRDVVFVLDVSRSMLARDRQPDRLTSARLAIGDLVEHLQPGDRVGLVVFAGSALIVCPLTTDFGFFQKALEEAGPSTVAFGGTRIGDALRKTADKLLGGAARRGLQDVILLTDGGDQKSEIEKAVDAINDAGAALLVIGLGSDSEGARIPEGERFVVYRGREVWSRQESVALEETARRARSGLYLNAGTRAVDLPNVYRRFAEHSAPLRSTRRATDRREEEFPWFLGAALFAMFASGGTIPHLRRKAALVAIVALGINSSPAAPPPVSLATGGAETEVVRDAARYISAARVARDPRSEARFLYNAGTCWLQAAAKLEQAAAKPDQMHREASTRVPAEANQPADDANSSIADLTGILGQSIQLYETALLRDPGFPEAARNLEIARARWRKAAAEQEKQRQESESAEREPSDAKPGDDAQPGDDSDDMNDPDADQTDSDQSKSSVASKQPADTALADLLNRNIPPPNVSPQDLIRRELENTQVRSAPSESKAKAVEKNW